MSYVYIVNGKEVTREEFLANGPKNPDWLTTGFNTSLTTYREHDPLLSDGLGCLKSQVPELREVIRKHNIKGVRVQDSGKLEITSRRGRRDLLRVRGLADADGGYGD
jgi:hypothetical protein